jgi:hypothetical protein
LHGPIQVIQPIDLILSLSRKNQKHYSLYSLSLSMIFAGIQFPRLHFSFTALSVPQISQLYQILFLFLFLLFVPTNSFTVPFKFHSNFFRITHFLFSYFATGFVFSLTYLLLNFISFCISDHCDLYWVVKFFVLLLLFWFSELGCLLFL